MILHWQIRPSSAECFYNIVECNVCSTPFRWKSRECYNSFCISDYATFWKMQKPANYVCINHWQNCLYLSMLPRVWPICSYWYRYSHTDIQQTYTIKRLKVFTSNRNQKRLVKEKSYSDCVNFLNFPGLIYRTLQN